MLAVDYRNQPKEAPVVTEASVQQSAVATQNGTAQNIAAADAPPEDEGLGEIKFRPTSALRPGTAAESPSSAVTQASSSHSTPSQPSAASRKGWASLFKLARTASGGPVPTSSPPGSGDTGLATASAPSTPSSMTVPRTRNTPRTSLDVSTPALTSTQSAAMSSARKLEAHEEDEEDLRERERLKAEMALLGIHDGQAGKRWGGQADGGAGVSSAGPVETSGSPVVARTKSDEDDVPTLSFKTRRMTQTSQTTATPSPAGRKTSGVVGLGIASSNSPEGAVPTTANPPLPSAPLSPSATAEDGTPGETWGKAFKRLSRGWSSPSVGPQ